MLEITLTEEQAKMVASAMQLVQVRDPLGNVIGTLTPVWTKADIDEAKRILASDESWSTTEQMLARLRSRGQP
jgi:hypothetical protein